MSTRKPLTRGRGEGGGNGQTRRHGEPETHGEDTGGSTGVAKRRALTDRIGNRAPRKRVAFVLSDPISQRSRRAAHADPSNRQLRVFVPPCFAVRARPEISAPFW